MRISFLPTLACALGWIVSAALAQNYRLEPLTTFGPHGDGSLRPGDNGHGFLTADGARYQRGMAYNPVTGHLLVVNRDPALQGIFILDGVTGDFVGNVEFTGFLPGGNDSFVISLIAVAEDGAIYVGNLTSATSPPQYRLYRWENETAAQALAYAGDPSNGDTNTSNRRWGDTIAIRGSGANTEIVLASRGTLISFLTPLNGDVNTFTSTVVQTTVPPGALGYGITLGPSNSIYGTAGAQSGGPLYVLERLPGAADALTLKAFGASLLPNTLTPIATGRAFGRDFLAGISMVPGPDLVRLYDVSSGPTNTPVFLDRESFITSSNNAVFAGAIAFGSNRVYALDSDNGIMAFSIVETNSPVVPEIFLQPASRNVLVGSNVVFAVSADGTPPFGYQWFFGSNPIAGATSASLVVSNAQPANAGSYSVTLSNAAGPAVSSNAVLAVTSQPVSSTLVYESFNYDVGTALTDHGGWLLNSGTSATVEPGNLSAAGLVAASGSRIFWRQASMSVRLPLGTNITSGTVYYSFAMNVESLGGGFTGNGVLAGFTTGTGTSFGTKVDIRNNAGASFTLGTSKAGSGTQVFDTNNLLAATTIFLVGRYTFNPAASDDVAELWINPDPVSFGAFSPPPPNLATSGGTDLPQIDRFFFRAGSATTTPDKLIVDELRVGTTWAAVTPAASAPRLLITLSGGSVLISWPADAAEFVLESTLDMPAIVWEPVTAQIMTQNGTNTVAIFPDDEQRFYRLRR
jgi:hypothetical protein